MPPKQENPGRETAPERVGTRRTALSLFFLFLGLYMLTMRGTHTSVDDIPRYNLTIALLTRRTIEVPPSLMAAPTRVDGRTYSKYGIGMSLAMAPLWLAGEALDRVAPADIRRVMERPHIFAMSTINQWLAAAACALLFLVASRLGYRRRTALLVALAAGLASMLWLYSQTSFENVLVAFLIEVVVLVLVGEGHLDFRAAAGAGAAMGFVFLTRWGDGWILLPGATAMLVARLRQGSGRRGSLAAAVGFATPALLGIAAAMLYNYVRFFDPFELGYDDDNVSWRFFYRGLFGFLFSPAKSVFIFTPLLVLAVARYGRLWTRLGQGLRAAGFFWLIAAPLAAYSFFETWDGGWCFGPRYLLPSVALAMVALGEWIEDERWSASLWPSALFALFLAAGIYGQWVCLASNFNDYCDSYYAFLWRPEACPLLACAKGFYRPSENFWFWKMLATVGLTPATVAMLVPPLALLGFGLVRLRGDLAALGSHFVDRMRPTLPRMIELSLAAVTVLAIVVLTTRTRTALHWAAAAKGQGLTGTYFANAHWRPPAKIVRIDPVIDFDWSGRHRPFRGDFSVRWTGRIEAPAAGTYLFGLDSCGTATLWLDGRLVIANRGPQPGRRLLIRSVHLRPGSHSIRVEFASSPAIDHYEINGAKYARSRHLPTGLKLRWKPPDRQLLRTVPSSVLSPGGNARQTEDQLSFSG